MIIHKTMAEIEGALKELLSAKVELAADDPRIDALETIVNGAELLSGEEKLILRNILVLGEKALHDKRKPLSSTDIEEHSIELVDERRPIYVQPKALTRIEVEQAVKLLDHLLNQQILRKVQRASAFNCPPKFVPKKTGKLRLVSTFVRLNAASANIPLYPMARIDDILASINNLPVLSTLDFQDGYFQVRMKQSDAHKTAFSIPNVGQFEYARMPMGLSGAPATFNFVVDQAVGHMRQLNVDGKKASTCSLFVDDLILASSNNRVQLFHLHQMLQQLARVKMVLSPEKMELFKKEVQFCGESIDEMGILPSKKHQEKLRNFSKPVNAADRDTFVGYTNYLTKYIKDEKHWLLPINDMATLNDREKTLVWTPEAETAFEHLRQAVSDNSRLTPPVYGDPECVFILSTDASNHAMGAMLFQMQWDIEGKLQRKLLSHASRVMNSAEKNYGISEKEALACMYGLKVYRRHILGQPLILETDHAALRDCFTSGKSNNQRLNRWLLIIQEYNLLDVVHVKGQELVGPDFLSRLPPSKEEYEKLTHEEKLFAERCFVQTWHRVDGASEHLQPSTAKAANGVPIDVKQSALIMGHRLLLAGQAFREEQLKDPAIAPLLQYLESPQESATDEVKSQASKFVVIDGRLFRIGAPRQRLVVPKSMISDILHEAHSSASGGHLSPVPVFYRLRLSYFWNGMHKDIVNFVKNCPQCRANKEGVPEKVPSKHMDDGVPHPFHTINIDVKGPLPVSPSGNQYIISIICVKTNWVEAYAVKQQTMEVIRECLVDMITKHGVPRVIVCDQGSVFTSAAFTKLMTQWGIQCKPHAPYAHWLSGAVERFHRSIGEILKHYLNAYKNNWDDQLAFAIFAYRIAHQNKLRSSPFYQLYGREPETPDTVSLNLPELVDEDSRSADQRFVEAAALSRRHHGDQDGASARPQTITKGHWVLVRAATRETKLHGRFMGPYLVNQASRVDVEYVDHKGKLRVSSLSNVKLATPEAPFNPRFDDW